LEVGLFVGQYILGFHPNEGRIGQEIGSDGIGELAVYFRNFHLQFSGRSRGYRRLIFGNNAPEVSPG
jgi:hypothetical protein